MTELFDMSLRAKRRDRAARMGAELFLYERAFADCLERLGLMQRRFARALLIGCPDSSWPGRLRDCADQVDARDPGPLFAAAVDGNTIIEDQWAAPEASYDLVVALGTLDTVNDLPLALRLIRHAMAADGLFIGACCGGDSVPQLRAAMRAADAIAGGATPHVHPRIAPAALAPLLADAGFVRAVVDVDRVAVGYRSLSRLVEDLRAMGATNVLKAGSARISRPAADAAARAFAAVAEDGRTVETFDLVHFASWTPQQG